MLNGGIHSPPGLGQLKLGLLEDWRDERRAHTTKEYMLARAQMINAYPSDMLITCHFCGFPDDRFLELHHKDGNHKNYAPENLVLACSCCHRLHHLGWIATENLGRLSFIPQEKSSPDKVLPLLEMINLFQFYKLAQGYGPSQNRNQGLNQQPIGGLFKETRMLVNSSGMANNYASQLAYEFKKQLIHQKRQELNPEEEEKAKAEAKAQEQNQQESQELLGETDAINNSQQKDEMEKAAAQADIDRLQEEVEEIERIKNAMTSDDLQDMSEKIKRELLSDFQSYAAGSLHLLDVLEMLDELNLQNKRDKKQSDGKNTNENLETTATELFLNAQNEAIKNGQGIFTIEFNPSILEPWHPNLKYTLDERIKHYVETLGIASPIAIAKDEQNRSFVGIDGIVERLRNVTSTPAAQQSSKG